MINPTDHAIARYAEHNPGCFAIGVRHAVADSTQVPTEVARVMMGRVEHVNQRDGWYALSPDRRGLFVLQTRKGAIVVITYIRLGAEAEAFAKDAYPSTDEPGAVRTNAVLSDPVIAYVAGATEVFPEVTTDTIDAVVAALGRLDRRADKVRSKASPIRASRKKAAHDALMAAQARNRAERVARMEALARLRICEGNG